MADTQPLHGGSVTRRHFLTTGPEEPILTTDPTEHLQRFETFVEATGLPPERVLLTPVAAVPLPVAANGVDGKPERWQVNPEMMWHPLFWMPERLGMRYSYQVIDDESGAVSDEFETESDEIWAVRVMLELVRCGIYDESNGTWLDVLAWNGIDVNDPIDLARVQVWQEGEPDDVLDNIDLTDIITSETDPEWALRASRGFVGIIIPAQWSLSAGTINAQFGDQIELNGDTDEERRKLLNVFGRIAANALRTLPAADEEDITSTEFLTAIVDQADDPEADSEYLTGLFRQHLTEVEIGYEPIVRGLAKSVPNDREPYGPELLGAPA